MRKPTKRKIFSDSDVNEKMRADERVMNIIIYLLSGNASGRNICPWLTPECALYCLVNAGMGVFKKTRLARLWRTNQYLDNRPEFLIQAKSELIKFELISRYVGKPLAIRPNGTSDMPSLAKDIVKLVREIKHERVNDPNYPKLRGKYANPPAKLQPIMVYDYTKQPQPEKREIPGEYYLIFSAAETEDNMLEVCRLMWGGISNVAMVFNRAKGNLPTHHTLTHPITGEQKTYQVIDGDKSDNRWLDKRRPVCIVGLSAKGPAKKAKEGFVVAA